MVGVVDPDKLAASEPVLPGLRSVPPSTTIGTTHFVATADDSIGALHEYLQAMIARPAGHPDGGPMDVDGAYCWFRRQRNARTLIADPEIGRQRASSSNISPHWFDRSPLLAGGVNLLRKLRRSMRSQ